VVFVGLSSTVGVLSANGQLTFHRGGLWSNFRVARESFDYRSVEVLLKHICLIRTWTFGEACKMRAVLEGKKK